MAEHRLPGMSIDMEQWSALADMAKSLGITRSDVIRLAIDRLLDPNNDTVIWELVAAQRQLHAIKAVLADHQPTVAA